MFENQNSFEASDDSWIQDMRYQGNGRRRFLYVIAFILGLSAAVTLIVAYTIELTASTSFVFFGLMVAGPFMTLGLMIWGSSSLVFPILGIAIIIALATSSYLIRPNNATFGLSLAGAVAWVVVAPILVILLPEMHIRV